MDWIGQDREMDLLYVLSQQPGLVLSSHITYLPYQILCSPHLNERANEGWRGRIEVSVQEALVIRRVSSSPRVEGCHLGQVP